MDSRQRKESRHGKESRQGAAAREGTKFRHGKESRQGTASAVPHDNLFPPLLGLQPLRYFIQGIPSRRIRPNILSRDCRQFPADWILSDIKHMVLVIGTIPHSMITETPLPNGEMEIPLESESSGRTTFDVLDGALDCFVRCGCD
jgi:hypothetical protein